MNVVWTGGYIATKHRKDGKRDFLFQENTPDTRVRSEAFPRKYVRRFSQETGISKSILQAATKLLRLKPYKFTVMQNLQRTYCATRV